MRNSQHVITINKIIEVVNVMRAGEGMQLLRSFKKNLDQLRLSAPQNDDIFWHRLCGLPEICSRSKIIHLQDESLLFRLHGEKIWPVYFKAIEDVKKNWARLEQDSK